MLTATNIKGKYLEYKGKPLVRNGNEIFYGDMSEKFYLFMLIMAYADDKKLGQSVPDKVMVQIVSTEDQKVEKNTIANGLYEAFDIGSAWLDRFNR